MTSSLVKSAPPGDFAEISALMTGWEAAFQTFVNQKRAILFDHYPLSGFPEDIKSALARHGYHDHILENDRWQHFLVPISKIEARMETSFTGGN